MKMNYISLQLIMWVYMKTDFMNIKMLWSSGFFPISWPLISIILYHCTWEKFLMLVSDVSANHIFHVTRPAIKHLKVFHVWVQAFLVGLPSVITIYWLWNLYWYYAWQNVVDQNHIIPKIHYKRQLQLCRELVSTDTYERLLSMLLSRLLQMALSQRVTVSIYWHH